MLPNYLYLFLFIIFLSQPDIIKLLYSDILGRFAILLSIIFCTYQNQMLGFVYTFILIVILKIEPNVENFGPKVIPANYEEPEDLEPEISIDREKMEKKLITPVSSNNSVPIITPLIYDFDYNSEPISSDPITTESFLDYSYISDNEDDKS